MVIQNYFARLKASLDRYATTSFVLETKVNFETRPGDQGYLTGSVEFIDSSKLYFSEFLDTVGESVDKIMYRYHYQDAANQLIFRYDNATHRPSLPFLEHKHDSAQIFEASAPTLNDVLTEIALTRGWL